MTYLIECLQQIILLWGDAPAESEVGMKWGGEWGGWCARPSSHRLATGRPSHPLSPLWPLSPTFSKSFFLLSLYLWLSYIISFLHHLYQQCWIPFAKEDRNPYRISSGYFRSQTLPIFILSFRYFWAPWYTFVTLSILLGKVKYNRAYLLRGKYDC